MKITAGIFFSLIIFTQIGIAQLYTDYGASQFYFYHEPSTSAESTGKIYLIDNMDGFASIYNPALPSRSDHIRFSYSKSEKTFYPNRILYDAYGIDIPISKIGTFSIAKRYFDQEAIYSPLPGESWLKYTSFNFNYSREIIGGLYAGIGLNYFKSEEFEGGIIYPPTPFYEYYSLNIGASYKYSLPGSDIYSHQAIVNLSVVNIPILNAKETEVIINAVINRVISPEDLPQIDNFSLGYLSKYRGLGLLKGLDDFQGDIQIQYSDLLNSRYYNTISLGVEIKFLEIVSLRGGYYNFDDHSWYPPLKLDKITYGFGLSFPLKLVSDIPLELGIDYSHLKNPYFSYNSDDYFDSFSLNIKYEMF